MYTKHFSNLKLIIQMFKKHQNSDFLLQKQPKIFYISTWLLRPLKLSYHFRVYSSELIFF